MSRQMNCDQVFEILTRGPFPSGDATDGAVETHLLACHECRELAEALRPAVDLFHESIPVREQDDLPGYHGALCHQDDAPPRQRANTIVAKPPMRIRQMLEGVGTEPALKSFLGATLVASALFVLVSLGAMGKFGGSSNKASPNGVTASSRANSGQLLALLDLPASCRRAHFPTAVDLTNPLDVAFTQDKTQCCTQCHSASQQIPQAKNAINRIVDNCVLCHAGEVANSLTK